MAVEEKLNRLSSSSCQVDEAEVTLAQASRKIWARIRSMWLSW